MDSPVDMLGSLFEEPESSSPVQGCSPYSPKINGGVDAPPPGRGDTSFCGIKNQGATCYLNSLLQTLLLTPELRTELFRLGPEELGSLEDVKNPNCKVRKIPVQLQILLARLLLLNQYACSTKDLTESFGWVDSENLQQHDVQELSRILFCAIEDSLVGTSGHNIIKNLYRGVSSNNITCLCCGKVSENLEDFLDLNIAITGGNNLISVLHNMFVETELMNDKNQYRCDGCQKLVDARKGAVIKTLPPILTFSLLRFSFNFETLRRFKETRKFEFPLTLNMKNYCDHSSLNAVGDQRSECYDYDLYSVIIHSGNAHGGHYHAYIRDVDSLGTVPPDFDPKPQIFESSPEKTKAAKNFSEDAVEMLACVLAKLGGQSVPLDKLGEAFRDESGTSWGKQYRRKHGTMIKFLQSNSEIFTVDVKSKTVSFCTENGHSDRNGCETIGNLSGDLWMNGIPNGSNDCKTEFQVDGKQDDDNETELCNGDVHQDKDSNEETPGDMMTHPLSDVWFDFNDSHIKPITMNKIREQYEGRESAYMLFYRRRDLKRPIESLGNLHYGMPDTLRDLVEKENSNLDNLRTEYDNLLNVVSVRLFFPKMFHVINGLIKIADNSEKEFSEFGISYSIDRRKTIADMMKEMSELAREENKSEVDNQSNDVLQCHVIKKLEHGGIHIYDLINDDPNVSIEDSKLENGMNVIVWDGKTLKGKEVLPGVENEPMVIEVKCLINKSDSYLKSIVFHGIVSCCATLADLGDCLLSTIDPENTSKRKFGKSVDKSISYLEDEEVIKQLHELNLGYEESFVVEVNFENPDKLVETDDEMSILKISCGAKYMNILQENIFQNKIFVSNITTEVEVSSSMLIGRLKSYMCNCLFMDAAKHSELQLDSVCLCLEMPDWCSALILHDTSTISNSGVSLNNSNLKLIIGSPPAISELHITLFIQKGSKLKLPVKKGHLKILCKSSTVNDCIKKFVQIHELSEDAWHLRLLKSERDVGDAITSLTLPIEKTAIKHGSSLILCPGGIPSEGRIRIQIWFYHINIQMAEMFETWQKSALSIWEPAMKESDLDPIPVGHVEIEKDATLFDLKSEILKMPFFVEKNLISSDQICLRSIAQKLPTKFHLQDNSTVKRLRLGPGDGLAVQSKVAKPEQNFISLHATFHTPGTRQYVNPCEYQWNQTTPLWQMPGEIASILQLDVKTILVARESSENWEWEIVKSKEVEGKCDPVKQRSTTKKNAKSKKTQGKKNKKVGSGKTDSLCPLKDGDRIRIKCISKEMDTEAEGSPLLVDFKSDEDVAALERLQELKSREQVLPESHNHDKDSNSISNSAPVKQESIKSKKEETLHIHVDKF